MVNVLDVDRAYANGAFISGSELLPGQWEASAASFRAERTTKAQLNIPYGGGARQQFDLFLPEATPTGLVVFVHGGYWLESGRESWSHLAAGVVARGWACAMPSYTLAPDARISEITVEIANAVKAAASMVEGPVVVTGHSAGGHLAARMACTNLTINTADRIVRVVPISPLADLGQIAQTRMNNALKLTDAEVDSESPARLEKRATCQAHVWVGMMERPAFLWQARLLSEAWDCPWTPQPDRNHFSVLEDLTVPGSDLVTAIVEGL